MTDDTLTFDQVKGAPSTLHQLTVSLEPMWGLKYKLQCLGNADSACHIYQDLNSEGYSKHEDCAIIDWFDDDPGLFVLEGYNGPAAPGLVSGRITILSFGEDGTEWLYAEPENSEWAVGTLA